MVSQGINFPNSRQILGVITRRISLAVAPILAASVFTILFTAAPQFIASTATAANAAAGITVTTTDLNYGSSELVSVSPALSAGESDSITSITPSGGADCSYSGLQVTANNGIGSCLVTVSRSSNGTTVTGLSLTGSDAVNYNWVNQPASLRIPAQITGSVNGSGASGFGGSGSSGSVSSSGTSGGGATFDSTSGAGSATSTPVVPTIPVVNMPITPVTPVVPITPTAPAVGQTNNNQNSGNKNDGPKVIIPSSASNKPIVENLTFPKNSSAIPTSFINALKKVIQSKHGKASYQIKFNSNGASISIQKSRVIASTNLFKKLGAKNISVISTNTVASKGCVIGSKNCQGSLVFN